MPVWIVIVILLSIAATAGLASILMRINAPAARADTPRADSGDTGGGAKGQG